MFGKNRQYWFGYESCVLYFYIFFGEMSMNLHYKESHCRLWGVFQNSSDSFAVNVLTSRIKEGICLYPKIY